MTDDGSQAGSGAPEGVRARHDPRGHGDGDRGGHGGGHGGRASSWLTVTVLVLGFAIGGAGLCAGPDWFLFGTGATVCVMGGILLLTFRVFQDVVVEAPRSPYGLREVHGPDGPRGRREAGFRGLPG
ncbi:HGxxPAAW family protein [Streptosporangium sp. NPDC051022]|uniref:HGxxPAAW family protein n=1 Tax=Streptosporangium sp. NPDC051022 TaxID=3155752 RepID=UPI00343E7A72